MSIRKLFRIKRSDDITSSSLSTARSNNNDKNKKKNTRRPPQRTSSTLSQDSRSSCSSTCSSISFSETVEVREIAPLTSLTDTPQDLWYQQEDYSRILERNRRLAKCVESREKQDQEATTPQQGKKKLCTRGLEWMMEGTSIRKVQKQQVRRFVLSVQGTVDDEGMAVAYSEVTKDSVALARERASHDAKAIEVYVRR